MVDKTIHTLNARDNLALEVARDYFQLPSAAMFRAIQTIRDQVAAISELPLDLGDFEVVVPESKVDYLRSQKAGILEAAGLQEISATELAALITAKVSANYIYSMAYLQDHDVAKFNVMLELSRGPEQRPFKALRALKYVPQKKQLQLVTCY